MNLAELLKDLDDQKEVELAEGVKLRVGDLREFIGQQTASAENYAKQQKEAAERARAAQAKVDELTRNYEALTQQFQNLQGQFGQSVEENLSKILKQAMPVQNPAAAQANSPESWDPFHDPGIFKPFVDRFQQFDEYRNQIEKRESERENTIKQLGQMVGAFMKRATERELMDAFNSIEDRPEDLNFKQVFDYANSHRIADEYGVPDIRKAYREVAAPHIEARQNAHREKEAEKIRKEAMEAARKEVQAEQMRQRSERVAFPGMAQRQGNNGRVAKDEKVGGRNAIAKRVARDGAQVLDDLASGKLSNELQQWTGTQQFGL